MRDLVGRGSAVMQRALGDLARFGRGTLHVGERFGKGLWQPRFAPAPATSVDGTEEALGLLATRDFELVVVGESALDWPTPEVSALTDGRIPTIVFRRSDPVPHGRFLCTPCAVRSDGRGNTHIFVGSLELPVHCFNVERLFRLQVDRCRSLWNLFRNGTWPRIRGLWGLGRPEGDPVPAVHGCRFLSVSDPEGAGYGPLLRADLRWAGAQDPVQFKDFAGAIAALEHPAPIDLAWIRAVPPDGECSLLASCARRGVAVIFECDSTFFHALPRGTVVSATVGLNPEDASEAVYSAMLDRAAWLDERGRASELLLCEAQERRDA